MKASIKSFFKDKLSIKIVRTKMIGAAIIISLGFGLAFSILYLVQARNAEMSSISREALRGLASINKLNFQLKTLMTDKKDAKELKIYLVASIEDCDRELSLITAAALPLSSELSTNQKTIKDLWMVLRKHLDKEVEFLERASKIDDQKELVMYGIRNFVDQFDPSHSGAIGNADLFSELRDFTENISVIEYNANLFLKHFQKYSDDIETEQHYYLQLSRRFSSILFLIMTLFTIIYLTLFSGTLTRKLTKLVEELRESRKRFDLAMAVKDEGIWDWNLVTNEIFFDERYYTMAGYKAYEFPQNFESWAERVHPDDLPHCETMLKAYLTGESVNYDIEFRWKHKNSSWVWIQGRGRIVERDETGKPLRILGTHTDITERKQAKETIMKSLREKETLIRELYHRTKNTMGVIRGIIVLQSLNYPANAQLQQLVKTTEDRIQAISLVHQMLYQGQDLSLISIQEYINDLILLLKKSYAFSDHEIGFQISVEDHKFLIDTAIPLGLIINELVTNSLKYAFPDGQSGIISIALSQLESGNYHLVYKDNGVGVAEEFEFRKSDSLGLKLIFNIAEDQMLGKIVIENNGGIQCSLEFPENLYEARV